MSRVREAARGQTLTDPAVPTALGLPLEPRRPIGEVRLLADVDTVTGTVSPSLTVRLQGSNDLTTWTDLGTGLTFTAANQVLEETVSLLGAHRFIRPAVTAKAGTTPGVTGLDVSVILRRGRS